MTRQPRQPFTEDPRIPRWGTCPTCKKYADLAAHACWPLWQVCAEEYYDPNSDNADEWQDVRAADAQEAAEEFAAVWLGDNPHPRDLSTTVVVRPHGRHQVRPQQFTVTGEPTIDWRAREETLAKAP